MELKNKKVFVIYHREDNDGVCSAAITSTFMEQFGDVAKVRFFGCNYAELATLWEEHRCFLESTTVLMDSKPKSDMQKWLDNNDVIVMVDISFNEVAAMDYLYKELGQNFIWCDHHAPIIEASLKNKFGECPGIRNTGYSALRNTWDYFTKFFEVRLLIPDTLVQLSDYDCWSWTKQDRYQGEGKNTLFALNTGFTRRSGLKVKWFENYILNIIHGQTKYTDDIDKDCLNYGITILEYDKERNRLAITSHGDTTWAIGGEKACAVFTTDRFNSQSFTDSFADTDIRHGLTFKRTPDGRWILSAYNVSEDIAFHCGEYLKEHYNGGGHKGAAGCTLSEEQFIEMLRTHTV